jgi:ABC-type glutathione transport system ATPase component
MKNVYVPMKIKFNGQLIAAAYQLYKFTGINWVLEDEEKFYTSEVKLDEEAEKTINTEANREMILSFFERLEKYGIKFEQSQKRMLVSPGNTLALGRSGTGKTTVSAFKILAIDLLFKAYSKAKITGKQNVVLEPKDLSLYSGCGIIFCTASPVLTNEVRRYYKEINDKIKEYLLIKQNQRLQKKNKAEAKKKEDTKLDDDERSDKTDEELAVS